MREVGIWLQAHGSVLLAADVEEDPIQSAGYRYAQQRGSLAYDQLLKPLPDEVFPAY